MTDCARKRAPNKFAKRRKEGRIRFAEKECNLCESYAPFAVICLARDLYRYGSGLNVLTGKTTAPLDECGIDCAVALLAAAGLNGSVTVSLALGSDTLIRTLTTSGWLAAPVKICVMTKLCPLIILRWLIG